MDSNKKFIFSIIFFSVFSFLAMPVSGQETGVSISPLTFELTANPGDIISNKLKIFNPTQSTVSIKIEVEDFKTVGEAGQVMVSEDEEMTYSLKRWVTAIPSEFILEPNEQKAIDFFIDIPENAEPGGKYGSILASTTGVVGEEMTGAAVAQKVGSLVLLSVAGHVNEDLMVKEFKAPKFSNSGPVDFDIKLYNSGTIHLRPRGFVTITNWFGHKVSDVELPQLNVIPGATRKIEATWQSKWLFGRYTAMLVGSYGMTNNPFTPAVTVFWVFPWKVALIILAIIGLLFAFFYKSRKRWGMALRILFRGEK